ncbi:MAG TPA: class I tRNA ligase family protein, partial [Armatimonadota bacterium]
MDDKYSPQQIEAKWQQRWREQRTYSLADTAGKPKFFLLEMFAYPSGDLHMGHVRCYTVGDVQARYRIMKGFHVLHPPGFDAFGLNAENAAIQRQIHPGDWTESNMKRMREQYERMGFSY